MKLDKKERWFIVVLLMVHAAFFLLAMYFKKIYMGDSSEYIWEAVNIKDLGFFYSGNPALPISPELMTQRQPGYPFFLLLVYLFSINNWIVLVLQNVLSVFNIYYARKILLRIGYKKQYDWLMLLLVITYPAQFIYANTIAPDMLLQTFTILYFGTFVYLLQTKELKYAAYMSAALIAGLFVKPVLYPFVVAHVVILVGVFAYNKMRWQRVVLISLVPLMVVLLYNYENYERTGKFHFSSNQSFNAVYYFSLYFSHRDGIASGDAYLKKERADIAALPTFKEQYDHANKRGMELLKQHFVPYMVYHLTNTARIFIEPGKGEIDLFTGKLTYSKLYSRKDDGFYYVLKYEGVKGVWRYFGRNPSIPVVLLVFLFNCIKVIGIILFLRVKNVDWITKGFTILLLGYFALAAGPIANTRYFLPVALIATLCAVIGWQSVIERRKIHAG